MILFLGGKREGGTSASAPRTHIAEAKEELGRKKLEAVCRGASRLRLMRCLGLFNKDFIELSLS